MEKEMADSGKMYFEDLPKHVQDAIIDYIVSIIENKHAGKQLKNQTKCAE